MKYLLLSILLFSNISIAKVGKANKVVICNLIFTDLYKNHKSCINDKLIDSCISCCNSFHEYELTCSGRDEGSVFNECTQYCSKEYN